MGAVGDILVAGTERQGRVVGGGCCDLGVRVSGAVFASVAASSITCDVCPLDLLALCISEILGGGCRWEFVTARAVWDNAGTRQAETVPVCVCWQNVLQSVHELRCRDCPSDDLWVPPVLSEGSRCLKSSMAQTKRDF